MKFIKAIGKSFQNLDFNNTKKGVVHMDIWYDNMAVTNEKEITIFDFDFCGNGAQILDLGYFCKQLFHIEADKKEYERKMKYFLEGYQSIRLLSDDELKLIPQAGLAVYVFYLGVQAQRFDWSNIFLSENYLKMFYVARLKSWIEYNNIEITT
ncbi:phosphotransferase [Snuella lapsa]|uniref:Aminoglycoside phosphotransferase domain-containing protein n=1 Tax=Snuella lapsa TaxID=870481 RepID=A0ABP6X521_9FLAO